MTFFWLTGVATFSCYNTWLPLLASPLFLSEDCGMVLTLLVSSDSVIVTPNLSTLPTFSIAAFSLAESFKVLEAARPAAVAFLTETSFLSLALVSRLRGF